MIRATKMETQAVDHVNKFRPPSFKLFVRNSISLVRNDPKEKDTLFNEEYICKVQIKSLLHSECPIYSNFSGRKLIVVDYTRDSEIMQYRNTQSSQPKNSYLVLMTPVSSDDCNRLSGIHFNWYEHFAHLPIMQIFPNIWRRGWKLQLF